MPLSADERRTLRLSCDRLVHGFTELTPAETFREIADWCEANGVEHDQYGEGKLITDFEGKLARLLGMPAAAFMPSGIMAQLVAMRIWSERSHLPRFGLHETSHLENHEEQAYGALLGLSVVRVGGRTRPIVADDLRKIREPLASLIVELPMREIGGQLPTWDELEALKGLARERAIALHMDGARLWESRAFYERTHAQIAEGFDSVYVSLYKGIGGIAGAVLLGSEDFIATARIWRRRFGGTLIHQSPMIASAALRFDRRLALMDALFERTLRFALGLNQIAGIRTEPRVPQSNMLHVFIEATPDALLEARDAIAIAEKCWLFGYVSAADVPGWSRTELYIGDALLAQSDEDIIRLFERLMVMVRSP